MATLELSSVIPPPRPHYDRYVSQLTREIDLLTERNRSLENRIANAESRISIERFQEMDLDARNQALAQELINVENLCQSLRKEKDHILQVADNEIAQLRRDNAQYQAELTFTENQVVKLEKEKKEVQTVLIETKRVTEKRGSEVRDLSDLVNRLQEEKRLLAERIERLNANERALVLEMERLKRRSGNGTATLTPNQLETYMRHVEEDRNYWKHEVDLLQELLSRMQRQKKAGSPVSSSGYDSEKGDKPKSQRSRREKSVRSTVRQSQRQASPQKNGPVNRQTSATRNPAAVTAERDLDYVATKEARSPTPVRTEQQTSLRERSASPSIRERPRSPVRVKPDNGPTNAEVTGILRERDELRNLLNTLEKRVIDIQGHVRILTQERDHLNTLYDESRQELRRVREDLLATEESYGRTNINVQNLLKRAEDEREAAVADLRRLTIECDKLREDFMSTAELASRDKRMLEGRLTEAEHALRLAQTEREDLMDKIASLRQELTTSDSDLKRRTDEVHQKAEQLHAAQDSATKSRLRIDALQKHVESQEREIEKQKFELEKRRTSENVLTDQSEKLRQELKQERDVSTHHRLQFARRDQEYQDLAAEFEKKDAEAMHLSVELRRLSQESQSLQDQLRERTFQVQHLRDTLAEKEHAAMSLKKHLDTRVDELAITTRKFEDAVRENGQLKSDLSQAARDHRNLQQELRDSLLVTEDIRVKTQEYLAQIKHVEGLLAEKEHQQSQLLEKYRNLSASAEERAVQLRQLQGDVANLRSGLEDTERELAQTKETLRAQEQVNLQCRSSLSSSEAQVMDLQRALDEVTSQHRRVQFEKDELLNDLRDLREVCSTLEHRKNQLETEATNKGLDADQLAAQNDDLVQEIESLRDQLDQEHATRVTLQNDLQTYQEREHLAQLDYQEKCSEANLLKERLTVLTNDLECTRHDLERAKSRSQDLERDVERLNRAVSNERFEKERLMSELRIQSLSPGKLM